MGKLLERYMFPSLPDQSHISFLFFLSRLFLLMKKIPGSGDLKHVFHKQPGIQLGILYLLFLQPAFPKLQQFSVGLHDQGSSGISVSGKFSLRYSFQSKTASTAAMATSVISGVGSLVVSF